MINQVSKQLFKRIFIKPFSQNIYLFSMENQKKDQYGRPYPNYEKYPPPVLCADAMVIRKNKEQHFWEILMCSRGIEPHKGMFVLPGGHVDYNEAPDVACLRELKEEADLDGHSPELLCVKGNPLRDSRKHTVTVTYLVTVPEEQVPKGGDDATDAKFYPLKDIVGQKDNIGFDHHEMILDAIKKLDIKL